MAAGSKSPSRRPSRPASLVAAAAVLGLVPGCRSLEERFGREVVALGLQPGPGPEDPVTAEELAALPPVVQRFFGFMQVVGQPRVWSFRARMAGEFRLGPDKAWVKLDAWQYNTRLDHARIFHIQIPQFGLPILGRDTYLRGEGRMLIRPLDLFTVQDSGGEELAIGELVTYLNDGILFAPSMLLGPETTWTEVDDHTFDVSLTDAGRTVKGRVFLDDRGAPRDFETTDRFGQDPADPSRKFVRARWTTPLAGWIEVDGRPLAKSGEAVWHFPSGDFAYGRMGVVPSTLSFNVGPGSPPGSR